MDCVIAHYAFAGNRNKKRLIQNPIKQLWFEFFLEKVGGILDTLKCPKYTSARLITLSWDSLTYKF